MAIPNITPDSGGDNAYSPSDNPPFSTLNAEDLTKRVLQNINNDSLLSAIMGPPDQGYDAKTGVYTHTWQPVADLNIPVVHDPSVPPGKAYLASHNPNNVVSGSGYGGKSLQGIYSLFASVFGNEPPQNKDEPPDTSHLEHTPGAFAGFRAFKVGVGKRGEPVLKSMSGWSAGSEIEHGWSLERNEAACRKATPEHSSNALVPVMNCTCGFWAYPTHQWLCEEDLAGWHTGQTVHALVAGWGKYVVAQYGFKTQFMRPLAIVTPHRYPLHPIVEERLNNIDLPQISLAAVPTIIESHGLTTIEPEFHPERPRVWYENVETEDVSHSDVIASATKSGEIRWNTGVIREYRDRVRLEAMIHVPADSIVKGSIT